MDGWNQVPEEPGGRRESRVGERVQLLREVTKWDANQVLFVNAKGCSGNEGREGERVS